MSMLRSIREKKGLTLGQLAARSSISAKVLTEYEEGRQPIPLSHAKVIAKALWVPIEDLMPRAGEGGSRPSVPASAPAPASTLPAQPGQPSAGAVQSQPRPQSTVQAPAAQPGPQPQQVYAPPPQAPAPPAQSGPTYAPPPPAPAPKSDREPQYAPAQHAGGSTYTSAPRPGATGGPGPRRGAPDRGPRPPRPAPPPPKPITEGQTEELLRLAARLEMEQADLEQQIGKPVAALNRTDAKEWIKRLRDQANEAAPGGKVHFGQWPGTREDREATYLGEVRDSGARLAFKLFNGEEYTGKVLDYTPYTVTLRPDGAGEDMVLRKLALVYYRQLPGESAPPQEPPGAGVDSDRTDEPAAPETDSMDEDRGV